MFTNRRFPQLRLSGDWRADGPTLLKAVHDYLGSLENPDALDIEKAQLKATNGVKFPATAVSSSDANTLDDYDEGSNWTPVATFATPGDVSVTPSIAVGDVTKVGREVRVSFVYVATITHTTASGELKLTGLPYTANGDSNHQWQGALQWGGITKASYTSVVARIRAGENFVSFVASGSGVAPSNVDKDNVPTGGSLVLAGTITYRV